MHLEIPNPKFEIDEMVLVKFKPSGAFFKFPVKARRIENLRYDPETMQVPDLGPWIYSIEIADRDWRTTPENLVFSIAEIQESIRTIGWNGTAHNHNVDVVNLINLLDKVAV